MSRSLVALIEPKLVEFVINPARPSVDADGIDITHWRQNGAYSGPLAFLAFHSTAPCVVSAPDGGSAGPELWLRRLGKWHRVGYINDGTDVEVDGPDRGFAQAMNIIGVFERLYVAGTVSAGVATARVIPIDTWETA
jgi:hypothetical protein